MPVSTEVSSQKLAGLKNLTKRAVADLNLHHFRALVDDTGIIQHAKFSVPDPRSGYTTDDNARALVFAAKMYTMTKNRDYLGLATKFLRFLLNMQAGDGRLHNLMNYSRHLTDEPSTGDHLGRALWAAGEVLRSRLPYGLKASAKELFDRALPWVRNVDSPKTRAYAIKGLRGYIAGYPDDSVLQKHISTFASELIASFKSNSTDRWRWFEPVLTYGNHRLPEALLHAYRTLDRRDCLDVAIESLRFLISAEIVNGKFAPVGDKGWYTQNGTRSLYDQQPIEAGSMVEAGLEALRSCRQAEYEVIVQKAFSWFLGENTKSLVVYDSKSGGCYDGIGSEGLNLNQGSESTLAYLLSVAALKEFFEP